MDPDIAALAEMLEEAETFLRNYEISHWAEWVAKDARLIRNRDFFGVEHLLSAFGGMGSINDLSLAVPSKAKSNMSAAVKDDERFHLLLSKIHALATQLSMEEDLPRHRA